jgi:hypothetical protein
LATWPEYKSPEWKYLNFSIGTTGLTGMGDLSERCRFFNEVIPDFIPEKSDELDNYSQFDIRTMINQYKCSK